MCFSFKKWTTIRTSNGFLNSTSHELHGERKERSSRKTAFQVDFMCGFCRRRRQEETKWRNAANVNFVCHFYWTHFSALHTKSHTQIVDRQ